MTFNELRRSLMLRPEYGTIKGREQMEREIWNAALDAAKECCEQNFTIERIAQRCFDEIEKLKA